MFHIRKMKVADIPFAVQLANTMNWDMTGADFKFMIKLESEGCFVLFHGHKRAGIATCISFGKAAWFGNLVVKKECRNKGAGSLLAKHAINYLNTKGAETIGLYAYPHLVDFYKRLGFESDIELSVLRGEVTVSSKTQEIARKVKREVIPQIIAFDTQCFGGDRQKLLELILLNQDNVSFISTEDVKVTGYVAAKVYGEKAEIGPLMCYANREQEAVTLLEAILCKLNGYNVFICIPKKETTLLRVLEKVGLRERFCVARMFLGTAVAKNCIFTVESLERG